MSNSDSAGFEATWLKSVINNQSESWRLDYKSHHYMLGNEETDFKFSRHLIAFANVANRINAPCWMLFGVNEDDYSFIDIRDEYPGENLPGFWNRPGITTRKRQIDGVQERFRLVAENWIAPDIPDFHLEYGFVEPDKFVSYLVVEPTPTSEPFHLKRFYTKGRGYAKGTVFIRRNASSVELAVSEIKYLLQARQVDYLSEQNWRKLINFHLTGDFERFDLIAPSFQHQISGQNVDALQYALNSLKEGISTLLVVAGAGQGKTVFLHRLAYALVKRQPQYFPNKHFGFSGQAKPIDDYIVTSVQDELEVVPIYPVPVYLSLRMSFTTEEAFKQRLLKRIANLTGKLKLESLDHVFNIPGSKWIMLFDGIDELRNSQHSGGLIRTWAESLPPNVQVVIASRQYASMPWDLAEVIPLAPLDHIGTLELLIQHLDLRLPAYKDEIEQLVAENYELLELISCPRAMEGFVKGLLDNYLPPEPEMDRDQVEISNPQSVSAYSLSEGTIPIIKEDELQSEGTLDMPPDDEKGDIQDIYQLPELAIVMKSIVNYILDKEIKRQQDLGRNSRRAADSAQNALERIAWRSNWSSINFDPEECKKRGWMSLRNLNWNENIGFIQYIDKRTYKFFNQLLRCYAAAEYGQYLTDKGIESKRKKNLHSLECVKIILSFINELRTANGRPELTFIQGG